MWRTRICTQFRRRGVRSRQNWLSDSDFVKSIRFYHSQLWWATSASDKAHSGGARESDEKFSTGDDFSCLNSQFGCDMSNQSFFLRNFAKKRNPSSCAVGNDGFDVYAFFSSLAISSAIGRAEATIHSDSFSSKTKHKPSTHYYRTHITAILMSSVGKLYWARGRARVTHRGSSMELPVTGSSILVVTWWLFTSISQPFWRVRWRRPSIEDASDEEPPAAPADYAVLGSQSRCEMF